VDLRERRFVFSQLSSGSFRGADTYWADSFMPDLYKLSAEAESFVESGGRLPNIYASEKCRCTCIIDVLLNMLLETSRGSARHGSCGMGINEAAVRSATFPLYLGDVLGMSASDLYSRLRELRRDYLPLRLRELSADLSKAGEYGEMLKSDDVLYNAAEAMCRNGRYVQLMPQERLRSYD
jgi:adenylosuccinate synthase